jgi:hypothetical protein
MIADEAKELEMDIKAVQVLQKHNFICFFFFQRTIVSYVVIKDDKKSYLFKKIPHEYIIRPIDHALYYIGCVITDEVRHNIINIERKISRPPMLQRIKNMFVQTYLKNTELYALTVSTNGNNVCFIDSMKYTRQFDEDAFEYLFNHEEK